MANLKEIVLIAVLGVVILANCYDVVVDYRHGATDWHLYVEALVVLVSSAAIVFLLRNLNAQARQLALLRADLEASRQELSLEDEAAKKVRRDMGEFIQAQFGQWALTPSEREVALLLLKGLSFKEISAIRETTEKTVRQQASSIYRKAGVSGRASFSAWFIEDIL